MYVPLVGAAASMETSLMTSSGSVSSVSFTRPSSSAAPARPSATRGVGVVSVKARDSSSRLDGRPWLSDSSSQFCRGRAVGSACQVRLCCLHAITSTCTGSLQCHALEGNEPLQAVLPCSTTNTAARN